MLKLICVHIDTCLPDYFSGDARPWVCIIPWQGMTIEDIKKALHNELDQEAIGGNSRIWEMDQQESDQWFNAAKLAIDSIEPTDQEQTTFFNDLEDTAEDEIDFCESVNAYFVFIED